MNEISLIKTEIKELDDLLERYEKLIDLKSDGDKLNFVKFAKEVWDTSKLRSSPIPIFTKQLPIQYDSDSNFGIAISNGYSIYEFPLDITGRFSIANVYSKICEIFNVQPGKGKALEVVGF